MGSEKRGIVAEAYVQVFYWTKFPSFVIVHGRIFADFGFASLCVTMSLNGL